jgi:hypothetical protein
MGPHGDALPLTSLAQILIVATLTSRPILPIST